MSHRLIEAAFPQTYGLHHNAYYPVWKPKEPTEALFGPTIYHGGVFNSSKIVANRSWDINGRIKEVKFHEGWHDIEENSLNMYVKLTHDSKADELAREEAIEKGKLKGKDKAQVFLENPELRPKEALFIFKIGDSKTHEFDYNSLRLLSGLAEVAKIAKENPKALDTYYNISAALSGKENISLFIQYQEGMPDHIKEKTKTNDEVNPFVQYEGPPKFAFEDKNKWIADRVALISEVFGDQGLTEQIQQVHSMLEHERNCEKAFIKQGFK